MSRPAVRWLGGVLAALFCIALLPPAAHADVVAVDPAPIARSRLIMGTGQNLPPLSGDTTYFLRPGADQIRYYGSGRARADQAALGTTAYRLVKRWIRSRCDRPRTPAGVRRCRATVVFDIDETLLSNFGAWSSAGAGPCVVNVPVKRLYNSFRKLGVRVAILTGRKDAERADTVTCLQEQGITGWSSLTTMSASDQRPAAVYKAQVRKRWVRTGTRIVASVGDQVSDMSYGWLRYGFLMPNPVYYIP